MSKQTEPEKRRSFSGPAGALDGISQATLEERADGLTTQAQGGAARKIASALEGTGTERKISQIRANELMESRNLEHDQ
jgi:hypothetical protein